MLHDGVGGNEQGGHQPEKEGEKHVHMDLANGRHVPCEILRHGVRRIDGEKRPEQGKHASGKQRQRQQHHKEFEDGGKELQQAVEDRLHAAALLHLSCLLRDVLHHLFCQILHVHGLALHLQLLLGRLGFGHNEGKHQIDEGEGQANVEVDEHEPVVMAKHRAQHRDGNDGSHDGQSQQCGVYFERRGQTRHHACQHLVFRIAVEAALAEECLHLIHELLEAVSAVLGRAVLRSFFSGSIIAARPRVSRSFSRLPSRQ